MAETRIRAQGAGHSYDGVRWQFRDLDLDVVAGEVVAILGPNGRGKSTLLRVIAGLAKPRHGTVRTEGPAAFVPQSFVPAFPYTAFDIVLMGRARHIHALRLPGRRDRDVAAACMAELNIEPLAQRPFDTLSGGERQLVLLARALASETPILLLDEPAAALDLHHQDEVITLIRRVADRRRLAVLFTTHQPDHALAIADRVLLMSGDEHHAIGSVAEVMTEARLSELYRLPVRLLRFEAEGVDLAAFTPVFRSKIARFNPSSPEERQ